MRLRTLLTKLGVFRTRKNATAEKLIRLMPVCPTCGAAAAAHEFAELAFTVIDSDREHGPNPLLAQMQRHDWQDALAQSRWDAEKDAAVLYLLQCPNGAGVALVVLSPFELYAPDRLLSTQELSPEDIREARALGLLWARMGTGAPG